MQTVRRATPPPSQLRELPPEKKQFADKLIVKEPPAGKDAEADRGRTVELCDEAAVDGQKMNYILAYWEEIESGRAVTSRRVRAVYERLARAIRELDPASPYRFDEEAGERPIIFIEKFCKQSQGIIGAPLVLELFQKAYVQALFGFLEKETGFRQYRETMFLVGRKNGKSTLLSGIALYMLIADYEGAAEIYSVATKNDQAKKS